MNAWHSQEGQDRHIAAILKGKRGGYFIDLAANEPVQISNTRALERDYGWKGLCIEPNSRYWQALSQTRSCSLVTNPVSNVEEPMLMTERGAFSSFVPKHKQEWRASAGLNATALRRAGLMKVRTRRLDKLLTEHRAPATIDYLSLDVEGHEYEAMLSFPFDTHRLLLLSVERPKPQLTNLLTKSGFRYVCDHGSYGDEMWVFHGQHSGRHRGSVEASSSASSAAESVVSSPSGLIELPHCTRLDAIGQSERPRFSTRHAPRLTIMRKSRCMLESEVRERASRAEDPCGEGGGAWRSRCLVTAVEAGAGGQRWVLVPGSDYTCRMPEGRESTVFSPGVRVGPHSSSAARFQHAKRAE